MLDIKTFNSALDQLEEERGISREQILEAIEQALAAAYKKDYGKKGQIIRAHFDRESGKADFSQIKIVVDGSLVRMPEEGDEDPETPEEERDTRARFNPEHHILLPDAKKIKKDASLEEEIVFPLEAKDDYGRIAAQTAKQVIIQKIREAEKMSVLGEYSDKKNQVVSGIIQRMERGAVFIDLGRTVGIMPPEEQIPGEFYRQGTRMKSYVYDVSEGPRGVTIRLSRSHPQFITRLFEIEAPEIASGAVEIKSIAREAGSRSKIAVASSDPRIDPIGACVGQRGVRVTTVMSELGGEKIDIIPWSEDPKVFIANALSPAKITTIETAEEGDLKTATVIVADDQLSLAIGKGGQNVRLAVKLTNWKIDIRGESGKTPEGVVATEDVSATKEGAPVAPAETLVETETKE